MSTPPQTRQEKQFIADLRDGMRVDSQFLVTRRETRTTRSGSPYVFMELADKSGSMVARAFVDPEEVPEDVAEGGIARVIGRCESFRGELQLRIARLLPAEPPGDLSDYVPAYPGDIDELAGYLAYFVDEIHDPALGALVRSFFEDPEFLEVFKRTPGAKSVHHAYLGGLLEHTVAVATLCEHACVLYPELDRDLLLAAALLHDVGKVDELTTEGRFDYTDEGRFVGHLVLGEEAVASRIAGMKGFPQEKALRLRHAILSHHGELEWGSPKKPATLEALILHHIDNLDAKVGAFRRVVAAAGADISWTDLRNLFKRPLYVPRALAEEEAVLEEDAQYMVDD